MEQNQIYMTVGAKNAVPSAVVTLMIEMTMEVEVKDYLQVFRIEPHNGFSIIKLTQEVPEYQRSVNIDWVAEQELKLFFIDQVLMLAEEY